MKGWSARICSKVEVERLGFSCGGNAPGCEVSQCNADAGCLRFRNRVVAGNQNERSKDGRGSAELQKDG